MYTNIRIGLLMNNDELNYKRLLFVYFFSAMWLNRFYVQLIAFAKVFNEVLYYL